MQEKRNRFLFEGVILCSFDQILGPTPSAVHPKGFISDEEAKRLAEEAMLLLVAGRQDTFHTIMSFPENGKLGVVGVYPSPLGNTLAIVAVFNEKAGSILWRSYPLMRNLLRSEATSALHEGPDVAAKLFGEIQKLCDYLSEESDAKEVARLLEKSIEKAGISVETLIGSGQSRAQQSTISNLKVSLSNLLTALRDMKLVAENPV
nr:hypothetical protein [Candidatus Njordarchaeota archaeon]